MIAVASREESAAQTSTDPGDLSPARLRRDRLGRRVMIALLVAFVALGAAGLLGSKTSVASATGGGYTLTVTYPSVTRPGLPVRWEFEVRHPGGFSGPISIATTFDYLHLFDVSNLEPESTSSTASDGDLVYRFDPPPGDVFRVSMDGNTEPGEHELPPVTSSVLVGGRQVVSVSYQTRVVP